MQADSQRLVAAASAHRPARRALVVHVGLFAATLAIAAGAFVYYSRHWPTPRAFVAAIDASCPIVACDFVRHYYPMGKAVMEAQAPVPGYYYSQAFALFLHPLARLPVPAAVRMWTWLQAASVLAILAVGYACFARRSRAAYLAGVVLLLTGTPLLHDIRWGQVGALKCALVLLAFACYRGRLGALSALLLACATAVKYEMAIFAVIFVFRRDYDLGLLYGVLLTLLLFVLPAQLLDSWPAMFEFNAQSARLLKSVSGWAPGNPNSQYFPAVVARTLALKFPSASWLWAHARGVGYALAFGNLLVAWALSRVAARDALGWAFCLAFLCTPFLVVTAWTHYFVYMSFVQAFLLRSVLEDSSSAGGRIAKLGLLWLPAAVLASSFWFERYHVWEPYVSAGSLCYANLALLVLAHVQALPLLNGSQQRTASV